MWRWCGLFKSSIMTLRYTREKISYWSVVKMIVHKSTGSANQLSSQENFEVKSSCKTKFVQHPEISEHILRIMAVVLTWEGTWLVYGWGLGTQSSVVYPLLINQNLPIFNYFANLSQIHPRLWKIYQKDPCLETFGSKDLPIWAQHTHMLKMFCTSSKSIECLLTTLLFVF